MTIRLLGPNDEPALDAFLSRHRDSSMTLSSNIRLSGLVYRQAAFHGQYVAAFHGAEIVAVVGHAWNGVLLVQTPEQGAELARAVVAMSGRKVKGILGPRAQVSAAREALGLADAPLQTESDEALFALDLPKLIAPEVEEGLELRPFRAEDRATIVAWRLAYNVETAQGTDTPEAQASSNAWFDWLLADGSARVAVKGNELRSMSTFNARLPDIVQLGGIYTPPAFRRRHYARAAIAESLLAARAGGVQRAVLFASAESAMRCYASLGFERAGEFGLVLFA